MSGEKWLCDDGEEGVQLIDAVKNGDPSKLSALLANGLGEKVNLCIYMSCNYGDPALHEAIKAHDDRCVDILLQCPYLDLSAKSDYTSKEGVDALTMCIIYDNPRVFKKLMTMQAPIENPDDGPGATALIWAASENRIEYAAELVRAGADVNAQTRDGETALDFAIMHKFHQMANFLLDVGANERDGEDMEGIKDSQLLKRYNTRLQIKKRHRLALSKHFLRV